MTWFVLSLLSVFALAYAELSQQHLLNIKNPFPPKTSMSLTMLLHSLLALPIILMLGLASQLTSIFDKEILIRLFSISLIGSFAVTIYFKSFQVKNISLSSILISLSAVISTFLGIIFFQEDVSLAKFVGIALILGGIVVVNYANPLLEKNHIYGLLAGSLFGITYTLDKSIVQTIHPLIYIFWCFMFTSLFGFFIKPIGFLKSLHNKGFDAYKLILFSGIGYFIYNICTFFAYKLGGEVGRIDAINNSQIFLIILFEYFVLKHTEGTIRKIIAAIMAVSGIILLGAY